MLQAYSMYQMKYILVIIFRGQRTYLNQMTLMYVFYVKIGKKKRHTKKIKILIPNFW